MEIDPAIKSIETRASSIDGKLPAVLKKAGVAQTTWARWVNGEFDPRRKTLNRIEAAIAELGNA